MISNQVLQNTIDGVKEISHFDISVMDAEGREVATTAPDFQDAEATIPDFAASPADSQSIGPFQLFKVFDDRTLVYVLVVRGDSDSTLLVGRMAAFQITTLINTSREHYDRDSFMKNLLLDNLLLIDIYEKAKKLHITASVPRVVMLVEIDHKKSRDADVLAAMQTYSGIEAPDFVTAVEEDNVVIVRELSAGAKNEEIKKSANAMIAYLESRGIQGSRISYGTIVGELRELSKSYKEAKMALDVSKIFFEDRNVIAYDHLGIGRLIYQLPLPLCRMFIREIFKDRSPDEFDDETLTTINKFFDNNLNVSETSRQLFIHRNTLVYRLDKLQKMTGLDLRNFEDAITFKIALMVVKYMKYMDHN